MGGKGGLYISYHNNDIDLAFRMSLLLLRFYRPAWLDRLEIMPAEDWQAGIRLARERATGALALVTDDYLQSRQCRAEYDLLSQRGLPVTAVIARDFSTDSIANFDFSDWIDIRRWFIAPDEQSPDALLNRIPEADDMPQPGERMEYLRGFIHAQELALSLMPTSWAALRNSESARGNDMRPRNAPFSWLRDWAFTGVKSGAEAAVSDLRAWADNESHFALRGAAGSGKTTLARLLALQQAHNALRDDDAALPVWLDLALWRDESSALDNFIESQWQLLTYWRRWLEQRETLLVLDNYSDLAETNPSGARAIQDWIDASPKHRFIVLSRGGEHAEPTLPTLEIGDLTAPLAHKLASHHLTLGQQNDFRQLLRQREDDIGRWQLGYICVGMEILAADRALARNQWAAEPAPALIATRLQQKPDVAQGLGPKQLLRGLQRLAWSMMLSDSHRYMQRADAESEAGDPRIVHAALELGILSENGGWLRFHPESLQAVLAAQPLKRDGLLKFIKAPRFSAAGERIPRKWDKLALHIVSGLTDETRAQALQRIGEFDPLLAIRALRVVGQPEPAQSELVERLVKLCADQPEARPAFRSALASLPAADETAQQLIAQMGQYDSPTQLWLWQEARALPLELPLDFISAVAEADPGVAALPQAISAHPMALAVAWLVKLSAHADANLRRKAVWMLGELKYLPTAILLLDDLQSGQDTADALPALMKFAYSEVLARVLRWSQAEPRHRPAVVQALAERKRLVTSRILALDHARALTLNPEFIDLAVANDETDIAIGLAQIAAETVDLPEAVNMAALAHHRADEMREHVADAIKYLPAREHLAQLVNDIAAVLDDPPDGTVLAGSKLEALVFGQSPFDETTAQSAAPPALPRDIQSQLAHEDWRQRHRAINSLADLPAERSLPALLGAVDDDDTRVRLAAYEALARFPDIDAARQSLAAALSDDDAVIVESVKEILESAKSLDSDRAASDEPQPVSDRFSDADKVARTLRALRDEDWGRTQKAARFLRRFARHLRGKDDPDSLDLLCDALDDPNWSVRWAVAEALAALRNPAASPHLRRRLQDESWIVQVAAVRSLAELRAVDCASDMARLLGHEQASLREAVADSLGQLRQPQVIPALGQAFLRDADMFVRLAALKAIYAINPTQARPWLERALNDDSLPLRHFALERLAERMTESDLPVLRQLLNDHQIPDGEESSLHDLAANALRVMDTPASRELLNASVAERADA